MDILVIQNKIYEIRGKRVMLDFDLANLYQVETRRLKEQVKRNIDRFPHDFMFTITSTEWKEVIANCDNLPNTIKFSPIPPAAFSELWQVLHNIPLCQQKDYVNIVEQIAILYD